MVFTTEEVQTKALNEVNLEIKQGEFVAIMGTSGSGKSTLMNILGCLDKPTEGEYRLTGIDIMEKSDDELSYIRNQQIGFVFQSFNLIPRTSALKNVELPMVYGKVAADKRRARALELLESVGLGERYEHMPNELSGGQRQRVALARTLALQPEIILFDEPMAALDAATRLTLREELLQLRREFSCTIVYVTHDQEEALTLSDRIAVFNKGFIEQIGTPNEVYNHSQTEFVCNFIGDINRLNDDTVSALRAAGAEVDASKHNYIRLERLHVNVAPRGGEIALDGTVENCEYYGLYIKYYIHVGTQSLKVIEKNDGVNIYDAGQKVKAVFNPRDIMAYEPAAEAEVK